MSSPQAVTADTPTEASSKMSLKTKLQWCATIGIPVAIALMPPSPLYTKQVLKFLAVTIWAMFSWMFGIIPEIVVGFSLPVLYVVTGQRSADLPSRLNIPKMSQEKQELMDAFDNMSPEQRRAILEVGKVLVQPKPSKFAG